MNLVCTYLAHCRALARIAVKNERGAAYVEYALLLVFVAVVCVAAVSYFGGRTNESFLSSGSRL